MAKRLPFSVKKAEAHLASVDPVLAELIEATGPYTPRPGEDAGYQWMVRTILFQQLAGSAARAIQKKWYGLYTEDASRAPTPEEVLETSDEEFRESGISRQKMSYFRDLAAHVMDDRLDFEALHKASDDEVIKALTAVKGVGEWSAHMYMLFYLGRPDVLPTGDFGVRHGVQIAYGLEEMPTPARVREIAAPWAPYRSVASWYMWRATERVVEKARDRRS